MNRILILILLCLFIGNLSAQERISIDSTQIYSLVDSMPTLPDGSDIFLGIADVFQKNFIILDSLDCGFVPFIKLEIVVKYDGSITNKKVSFRNFCDKDYRRIYEAGMMALNKIPKCNPGTKNGKFVSVRLLMPIHIDLQ